MKLAYLFESGLQILHKSSGNPVQPVRESIVVCIIYRKCRIGMGLGLAVPAKQHTPAISTCHIQVSHEKRYVGYREIKSIGAVAVHIQCIQYTFMCA